MISACATCSTTDRIDQAYRQEPAPGCRALDVAHGKSQQQHRAHRFGCVGLLLSPTKLSGSAQHGFWHWPGCWAFQEHHAPVRTLSRNRSTGSPTYSTRRIDSGMRSRYLCAVKLVAQVCSSVIVGIAFDVCQTCSSGSRLCRMQTPSN